MCNLYTMTATVDEMRRLFGPFEGDRGNLPPFDEIYPGRPAPVLRRGEAGDLKLDASGALWYGTKVHGASTLVASNNS